MADKVTNELLGRIKKYEEDIEIMVKKFKEDKSKQSHEFTNVQGFIKELS